MSKERDIRSSAIMRNDTSCKRAYVDDAIAELETDIIYDDNVRK